MKKIFKTIIVIFLLFATIPVFATEYNEKAAKLLDKGEYEESIKEFSKTLKSTPTDLVAQYGIILANIEQSKQFLKNKEYEKAANNFRSALFYMIYFQHDEVDSRKFNDKIPTIEKYLQFCEKKLNQKNTPQNHYNTAKRLELAQEYPAAAYEYMQASKSKKLSKDSKRNAAKMIAKLGNYNLAMSIYDIFSGYLKSIQRKIKLNWNPPKKSHSSCIIVLFKIDREGNIVSKEIKESNGTKEAEEAAFKAIDDSAPFLKVPEEIPDKEVSIQFTFTYRVFGDSKNENKNNRSR